MSTKQRTAQLLSEVADSRLSSLETPLPELPALTFSVEGLEQACELERAMRAAVASNQTNLGTTSLMFIAMEHLGYQMSEDEVERAAGMSPDQLKDLALEGITDFISRKLGQFKDWNENRKTAASVREGKISERRAELTELAKSLRPMVQALPQDFTATVPVSRNAQALSKHGVVDKNITATAKSYVQQASKISLACHNNASKASQIITPLIAHLDLTSDDNFVKSLAELNHLNGLFFSNIIGHQETPLLGGVTFMPNPAVPRFEKAKGVEKLQCLADMRQTTTAKIDKCDDSEATVTLHKDDLLSLLQSAQDVLVEQTSGRDENRPFESLCDSQYLLFMIECQRLRNPTYRSGLNQHSKMLNHLQDIVIPFINEYYMLFSLRADRVDISLALSQLVRRAMKA